MIRNLYQVAKPYIDKNDIQSVVSVLNSGNLSLGPQHKKFEMFFAQKLGINYAVSVANGSCGLHLAIKSLGIKEGDEVITTPFSFISSTNCILYERAKPVFVDIEKDTFNIDPSKIESAITKRTKAILVVHIFGQSADMNKITKIAQKYNLKIIEDACESLGSTFNNKNTGTFGDVAVFAFYPNKQMTTGEGGMIITNNNKIYDLCKSLRNQGRDDNNRWLVHKYLGYNYRLSELHAALGISQLKKIDWMIKKRSEIAKLYTSYLFSEKGLILPKIIKNRKHSWFVYVVRIINKKRDMIMNKLEDVGIQTRPYLPSIHLQPFIRKMFNFNKGDFPNSEMISSQTLALPFYIGLTESDIKYITNHLVRAIHE